MGYDMYLEQETGDRSKDYFRASVWDMGRLRAHMDDWGMLIDCEHDLYPQAKYDAWKAVRDEAAHERIEHSTKPEAIAYRAAEKAWLEQEVEAFGIPVFKLGSNDGWLVTVSECKSALMLLHQPRDVQPALPFNLDALYWRQWLAFIHRASSHGGFRVY